MAEDNYKTSAKSHQQKIRDSWANYPDMQVPNMQVQAPTEASGQSLFRRGIIWWGLSMIGLGAASYNMYHGNYDSQQTCIVKVLNEKGTDVTERMSIKEPILANEFGRYLNDSFDLDKCDIAGVREAYAKFRDLIKKWGNASLEAREAMFGQIGCMREAAVELKKFEELRETYMSSENPDTRKAAEDQLIKFSQAMANC